MPKCLNILFASSEAVPFIKTGGLADVSGSLPKALSHLGLAVSVIIPAYREVLASVVDAKVVSQFSVFGFGKIYYVKLIEARVPIPSTSLTFWFIDIPELFDRPHGIYLAEDGKDWWDNGERFAIFSKAVTEVAMNRVKLDWKADVVHSNDWQTGVISVFLKLEKNCPKTVFTIHNMAYQGSFPYEVFKAINLPEHWWHKDGLEFYGNFSMLKAGILFSDIVTTVSPTYAKEICTPRFAYGLEGVMRRCQLEGKLFGILNGIDQAHWNPQKDTLIPYRYSASYRLMANKFKNKQALLSALGVGGGIVNLEAPLFGLVGRLIEQKGIDLILSVVPDLLTYSNANFVFLGSGDHHFEHAIKLFAEHYPDRVLVRIGYAEKLAHMIEAGADLFLMPSRFEPCGLNQLYSLAYGTLPIVHHTGGLADTVVNASTENIARGTATGFVFYEPTAYALKETMYYAISLFAQKERWKGIQRTAMAQNFSWENSAKAYLDLYCL